jgi:uncharacterized protein YbcI
VSKEQAATTEVGVSEVEHIDETQQNGDRGGVLTSVTNALVALHKEQFGRGPVRARTTLSDDTLVCTLHDALLPAELNLTEMGHGIRVQESRLFFQAATRDEFIATVEDLVGRKVVAFSSAVDPGAAVVWEIFRLQPQDLRAT